ncbi:MAG: sigma-70 family RNA polymerase sigma factor, partial [Verrucomicrobiota bacterium]
MDQSSSEPVDFERGARFTRLLLEAQPRLFGFVVSLTHDRAAAKDVTQEVGELLWRKFDEFQPGSDFAAWALKIARYKVMEWRRGQSRLPVLLDDEALELIADVSESASVHYEERLIALDQCLGELPDR